MRQRKKSAEPTTKKTLFRLKLKSIHPEKWSLILLSHWILTRINTLKTIEVSGMFSGQGSTQGNALSGEPRAIFDTQVEGSVQWVLLQIFLEISLNWGKILWLIFLSDWSVPFPDLAIEKKHDETSEPKFAWVGDSPPWVPNGLLMAEILHHLGWIKPCK